MRAALLEILQLRGTLVLQPKHRRLRKKKFAVNNHLFRNITIVRGLQTPAVIEWAPKCTVIFLHWKEQQSCAFQSMDGFDKRLLLPHFTFFARVQNSTLISFRCRFSLSAFQQLDVLEAAFLALGKAILLKYRGLGCVQLVHWPFWREKFRGWFLF